MNKLVLTPCLAISIILAGCKSDNDIVEKVKYKVAADMSQVEFSMVFSSAIKIRESKEVSLKEYGRLYIMAYENDQNKFTLGAVINPDALLDSDYGHFQKTSVLPNGAPMDTPYPLTEVMPVNPFPIGIFGYLDTEKLSWMGMAIDFDAGFPDSDEGIPSDITLSIVFLRDHAGVPILFGKVFGQNQSTSKKAGLSVFANFKKLFEEGYLKAGSQGQI